LNFLQQIEPAAPRHADVGHQDIRRVGPQRTQYIVGLIEAAGSHTAAFQGFLEHPTNGGIVIDQPHE
jgi:hypothetical protein